MGMLLVIDIGNSSITTGIFAGDRLLGRFEIPTRSPHDVGYYRGKMEAFLAKKSGEKPLAGVIISSVVPELTDTLARSVRGVSIGEPVTVDSLNSGLIFDLERPEEIGSDRVANAVAALDAMGSPVAVVDFGTATTISVVRDGCFLGGAILPGVRLMGEALHRGTAKLPAVDLVGGTEGLVSPVAALGKSTTMCIISGMIYGTAGAVERIMRGIEREEGCVFKVAATGGYSSMAVRYMEREYFLDPDLTLKGLRLIYERNA